MGYQNTSPFFRYQTREFFKSGREFKPPPAFLKFAGTSILFPFPVLRDILPLTLRAY
jgi:hypothetical protein